MKINDKLINYILTKNLDEYSRTLKSTNKIIERANYDLTRYIKDKKNCEIAIKKIKKYMGEEVRKEEGSHHPSEWFIDDFDMNYDETI